MNKNRREQKIKREIFSWSLRRDLILLGIYAGLGVAVANFKINIPQTPTYIEVRWIFGFLGFVLIRRLPVALLLPIILSLATPSTIPWYVILGGNLLYSLPFCFTLRIFYRRVLVHIGNMAIFGALWFLLVMVGYQVFTTPLMHLSLGLLTKSLRFSSLINAWSEQLWIEESLAVALVSTLGLVIARMYFILQYREGHLRTILKITGPGS